MSAHEPKVLSTRAPARSEHEAQIIPGISKHEDRFATAIIRALRALGSIPIDGLVGGRDLITPPCRGGLYASSRVER